MASENGQEHLDPTLEIELETVKKRTLKGVAALTGRTFILNVIAFIAQGFLWAFLTPEQFGVFWIVSAIVNFLIYFSDIGLAAALIQKKEKPSDEDLRTTFTVQQILVILLLFILFTLSPFFVHRYSFSQEAKYLLYALGISFFLSSLKSIPSVLLERKLEFGKFVLPQVLETVVYNLVLVILAWRGLGITSFSIAVVVRGVVGLVAIYVLEPWMPGITFSKKSLKKLLTFGVPYQINTLLAVLKDDGMTIILGSILGTAGVGILGTAQRLAQYPLRFFMDNVTKVTFPAFSRMQDQRSDLAKGVTRSIFFICFLVFPSIIGLVVLAPLLVVVIPRYEKWAPALIPLSFLAINSLFAAVTTQITNLFNAIGKIKVTFKLMIMWTLLTFLLIPFLSTRFGVVGAASGYALVGTSSVIAIYIGRRMILFSLWDGVFKPGLAAGAMGLVLLFIRFVLPVNFYSVIFLVGLGIVVYALAIYFFVGSSILKDVKKGLGAIFSK